jgi:hypothetical protein
MDSSRASLALQGFLPAGENSQEELDERLVRGRYAELRMLFYIGKDLMRWSEQCAETVILAGRFGGAPITRETFACVLVQHMPDHVREKLENWGVLDYCALFRRSIGLHTVFGELPSADSLSPEFVRRYHRHLDVWYENKSHEVDYYRPESGEFTFDLYASGEYTSLLEESWRGDDLQ